MMDFKQISRAGALIGTVVFASQCFLVTDSCACSPIEPQASAYGIISSATGPLAGVQVSVVPQGYADTTPPFPVVVTAVDGRYDIHMTDYFGTNMMTLQVVPDSATGLARADVVFTAPFSVGFPEDSIRIDVELQPSP